MTTVRSVIPAALAVGLLAAGIGIGMRWPGAAPSVAAGFAAVLGNLAALLPTEVLDARPQGENMWYGMLVFGSTAIAAHTVGTAVRLGRASTRVNRA